MKKLFTCGFHVYLSLEIFPYEAFVYKFKTQFLSKWWTSGLVISRTTENIAIIFSVIQIHIKAITFEKFHCCGDPPVSGLRQFFCHYFYSCFSYFSTFSFLFMVLISFVVTIYLSSNLCWLYDYFLSVYLKRTTGKVAREESRAIFSKCSCLLIIQTLFCYEALCNSVVRDLHGFVIVQQSLC